VGCSAEKTIGQYRSVIGISLVTLSPGRMGGSEHYARALTSQLARGTGDYRVAVPPDALDASGGLPVVPAGVSGRGGRIATLTRAALARQTLAGVAVVHYPLTVPLPHAGVPRVVTLHDVLHHDHPKLLPRTARAFRALAYDRAARRSDLVIVPTRFVKERAEMRIRLDPGRVRIVPHGIDHSVFRPAGDEREPFLLYPARYWPHKNHRLLFEAFAHVRRARPDLELVLTGFDGEFRGFPPSVRSVGFVSQSELARLYRTAEAMVFPSLYEGFGAPILEAMASGCPVAAADAGAIPEVAGGAAVLFDPFSVPAIADGILGALADGPTLAARGLLHAGGFSWDLAAAQHELVYSELLDSTGSHAL
jgi:glycosyltransferase involved in cell wall biosynthesis